MTEVRRAGPADATALLPLMTELFRLELLDPPTERTAPALARLLDDPGLGFVLMAVGEGGALAGYAICTFGYDIEYAGRDAYLTDLYVADASRRLGVGRALLDAVEREAITARVAAIHLVVRHDNDAALALYRGRGWAVVPRHFLSKML